MRAAIISLGSVSSQMQAQAMQKYFDHVDMIPLKEIEVSLGKNGGLMYRGAPFPNYDCVFLKGSFRYANLLKSIAGMLEGKVPYMPLPSNAFTTVHNKLLTHLALEQHNIPMPQTFISPTVEAAKELLQRVNYPIVIKFPEGTQGKGVMFADSISSAASMLDALVALNQPVIIQSYVETGGTDVRALVVGDKVVASMRRRAKQDDKRSNTHSGGSAEPVLLGHDASRIAVKTAKALGVDICGVDILESSHGPLVIEANLSPGMQAINSVSTLDIPDEIAKHLYNKTYEIVHKQKKVAAKEVMNEINKEAPTAQQVITSLTFRGDKIILPEFANKIARFNHDKEYTIKAVKGKIEIEEFNM